jgi:tellurite resistance protein TehA-like permease
MSDLFDVVLELLGAGLTPSSERGIVASLTAAALILASVALWLLLTHPQPLADSWGMVICVGSLAIGAAGLLTSLLHLTRNTDDRVFGALCLTANAAALLVPIIGRAR